MKSSSFRTAALVASLLLIVVLPLLAENPGRKVEPSEELKAFFAEHGVDAQYLGKSQAEMPADQWKKIIAIINTPADEDDHDELNSIMFSTLCLATDGDNDPVYLTIGNQSWCHECGVD